MGKTDRELLVLLADLVRQASNSGLGLEELARLLDDAAMETTSVEEVNEENFGHEKLNISSMSITKLDDVTGMDNNKIDLDRGSDEHDASHLNKSIANESIDKK